ncbi:leucyl aminopeptidase family protein [Nocardioides limicola]|uniref:leucyl aminopeptidase family protein n=1 Tax=Nocardioides limicola TaxID=2803368 RepID=UPI0027DAB7A1|nr:leucyl aminopeptidase family protein [Nocardioides sp. DJM-14]
MRPGADGPVVDPAGDVDAAALAALYGATGKVGEAFAHPLPEGPVRWLVLVGLGDGSAHSLRRAGAALARAVVDRHPQRRASVATTVVDGPEQVRAFVAGAMLAAFSFDWRSTNDGPRRLGEVRLIGLSDQAAAELPTAVAIGHASWRARLLATVPSQVKNPGWLAEQAAVIAADAGLEFRVWDEQALTEEGFGGIAAVGRASATPPRLIRLDYTPVGATRRTPHLVLVGKGITFDTGGLSIKPAEAMATMKRDMTGGGIVLAVLAALAEVGCPVKVTGLVAAAENAISGDAMRPGDVIRHYGGRTSEVTNTDAEGRLVMADALAYAAAEIKPDLMVDVATLTGAMKVALGQRTGGFFATDDGVADLISAAGTAAGEPVWRMPLASVYADRIASKIADADNAGGGPGAITAALFLQPFTDGVPWVHLDVASAGDSPSEWHEWTTGPTGFGARLLLEWLGQDAPLDVVTGG